MPIDTTDLEKRKSETERWTSYFAASSFAAAVTTAWFVYMATSNIWWSGVVISAYFTIGSLMYMGLYFRTSQAEELDERLCEILDAIEGDEEPPGPGTTTH